MNRSLFLVLVLLLLPPLFAAKQAPAQTTSVADPREARPTTAITGRVVASSGNFPIANARVLARAAGGASSVRMATTDDDGRFQITNLAPANYVIRVVAAGYVPDLVHANMPETHYRPGENVTVRMIKGGVITGRVVNQNGRPVALARVRAVRVRDEEGNPVRDSATRDRTTDDRGVYRIYGLEPGAYVVAANLTNMFRPAPSSVRSATGQNSEAGPTYHPSSTLDTATLVNVTAGNETGGIDIRYRPEHSYAVRGTVAGSAARGETSLRRTVISVTLSHAASGVAVAFTTIVPASGDNSFNFDGVPDGVYELTAQSAAGTSNAALAPPQRINVRGASVTDIVLTLTPMSSVSGRLSLEASTSEATGSCSEVSATALQETLITASAKKEQTAKQPPSLTSLLPIEAQPDARGEFLLTNMSAGKYSLNVKPQSSSWYVRDIAWESPTAVIGTSVQTRSDVLTLKSGERAQGLIIKLAPGAASIKGRVSATDAALPSRLHVYAVPVKREHVDDVLRYARAQVQPDGTFSLEHLAPDRYWLLLAADVENEHPFFDAKARAVLRRDAERANVTVDLEPCQQIADYRLRFMP